MDRDHQRTFQSLLDARAAAIVADDAEQIGAFAEPDWVIVGPEGGPTDRAAFLALVESGDLTHAQMTFEVLDTRVFGDTAIVVAHGTNQGHWQRTPFSADEWVTEVFVRRGDAWRCTMSALTPNDRADVNQAHRAWS